MAYKNDMFSEYSFIEKYIKDDSVPSASEDDIFAACETTAKYLTAAKNEYPLNVDFIRTVLLSLNLKALIFCLICALILASCTVLISISNNGTASLLAFLSAAAPTPFICFVISEAYQKNKNLIDVEKTCRYIPNHIFTARLTICMLINAAMLLILGLILCEVCSDIIRIYLCAFVSMFFIGGIAVLIISVSDNALPLTMLLAVWVLTGAAVTSNTEIIYKLEVISCLPIAIALCISLLIFIASILYTSNKIYLRIQ